MLKDILIEMKKSAIAVLPVYILVAVLSLAGVARLTTYEIVALSVATVFVVAGIALFNYGAEHAMTPIGKTVGSGLTKKGKPWLLFVAVFLFGVFITVAEPDLSVLAEQTESVFSKPLIIVAVATSVGVCLLLAIIKILKKVEIVGLLSLSYMLAFALVALVVYEGKGDAVALCFDAGGVTTGPMTVPFLMALGTGVASVVAQKSEKDAPFGFIAFSSIGPVVVMLALFLFSKTPANYTPAQNDLSPEPLAFLRLLLYNAEEVGLSVGFLLICYLTIEIFFLKSNEDKVLKMIVGLLVSFVGLVIFLSAVEWAYIGVGAKIGAALAFADAWVIALVAFLIGALTVLAEPAIKILITQVEETTNGLIKRKSMLFALAFGVGVAICTAFLRIKFGFSLLYVLIPAYVVCFALSFFVPKVYTAIAFDAGGVATGPLTSGFILPMALGLCSNLNGAQSVLSLGFGVVALVAVSPLVSIELLGVASAFRAKRRLKTEIKRVLKEDDRIIISFGD